MNDSVISAASQDHSAARPHLLFVDDSDQITVSQLRTALEPYQVDARLRHPEEAEESDLNWADLVVVDYFLTTWPERDETTSLARAPYNGLAAAACLRSATLPSLQERGPGVVPSRAVAFALWSSNLREATFELPDVILPHVFSRENNLEWAFRRDALLHEEGGMQLAILAHAASSLPPEWPSDPARAQRQMLDMLGLAPSEISEAPAWHEAAHRDVVSCRPPVHELSRRSHGLSLIRWMLHRILPYPCFLLDERQLCARLRVDFLGADTRPGGGLAEVIAPYRYIGTLTGFSGERWWRAGIEDWLFAETDGQSGSPTAVAELALRHGAQRAHVWRRPVIAITGDLARAPEFIEADDAVRLRPDDWPIFADDAFASREAVAEDATLLALVDPFDRASLELE